MNAYWSYLAGLVTGVALILLIGAFHAARERGPGDQPSGEARPPCIPPNQGSGGKRP